MNVKKHPKYDEFLSGIKDLVAKAKVIIRTENLAAGNPGKVRHVGSGVWEMKINYGPGWRVYYVRVGDEIVMLLTGGTKNGQQDDIDAAKKLAEDLTE